MPESQQAEVRFDVPVPMRDGTILPADIYLPSGGGSYPTLLSRTPYDRTGGIATRFGALDALTATQRGYAVVMHDVRGRHAAGGDFITFLNEPQDGYDTIEWIASQPWSDGNVGMFGRSYVGATQWLAATAAPPHLKAIHPGVTASDYHEGWTYQGGAFSLGFNVSWSLDALVNRNFEHFRREDALDQADHTGLMTAVDETDVAFRALPLKDQPRLSRKLAPFYYEWLEHPDDDDYWKRWRIEDFHSAITAPSLNLGGWYDIFLMGTIRNYTGMRANGGSEEARSGARLLIGPWSHAAIGANQVATVDFGMIASSSGLDLGELAFRWYDHWLKGIDNGLAGEPPVTIFVMGENVWRSENEWPLARAATTRYYLRSDGRANGRSGDGRLSTDSPAGERPDTFLYDPLDPVETMGGPLCCSPSFVPGGPMDHSAKEDRADVLVYSTPPMERDVEATGPVMLHLWAASSAVDTDFTGMLLDVGPCGCARNLTDGILRARYRNSRSSAELLTPGEPVELEIDLVATSNVFKKGHQIRLEVSSSNFPRFDRNLNTGRGFDDAEALVATNTVFHDSAHPSYLELDIVPR